MHNKFILLSCLNLCYLFNLQIAAADPALERSLSRSRSDSSISCPTPRIKANIIEQPENVQKKIACFLALDTTFNPAWNNPANEKSSSAYSSSIRSSTSTGFLSTRNSSSESSQEIDTRSRDAQFIQPPNTIPAPSLNKVPQARPITHISGPNIVHRNGWDQPDETLCGTKCCYTCCDACCSGCAKICEPSSKCCCGWAAGILCSPCILMAAGAVIATSPLWGPCVCCMYACSD